MKLTAAVHKLSCQQRERKLIDDAESNISA